MRSRYLSSVAIFSLMLSACGGRLTLGYEAFTPQDSDNELLGQAIQLVAFHVPEKHVYVLVEPMTWEIIRKVDHRQAWATRRAVCFAIYDQLAKRWEWHPHESSFTVYALPTNKKTVLLEGRILDCTVAEAASVWPWLDQPLRRPTPQYPGLHQMKGER